MNNFIELHKKKTGIPVIININRIKYIHEYNGNVIIWFEDGVYTEIEESYADIWLLLDPIRVMKKTNKKIELKNENITNKLIEDLFNSAGQFNELRPITTDSERGNICDN